MGYPVTFTSPEKIVKMVKSNNRIAWANLCAEPRHFPAVYSDMLGFDQYSGAGGQPDFVIGSQLCPDGTSIIVLPSTAAEGKLSSSTPEHLTEPASASDPYGK